VKKLKLLSILIFSQAIFFRIYGQDVTLLEGSFKLLNAEKTVDIEFTYDSLQVGKYKVEADYVE